MLDPYSNDPRRDGSIYAQSPVQGALEKFKRLLIRLNDFLNGARIASLWAAGDSISGRGMGKTALLRFFQQRINSDYGRTQFEGQFSAAVIYVAFPDQVERRWMEQLAKSQRGGFGNSWWVRRWIEVLEGFDLRARLSRGRSYARRGQVLSIDVDSGGVTARVQGSRARPYRVQVNVKTLDREIW